MVFVPLEMHFDLRQLKDLSLSLRQRVLIVIVQAIYSLYKDDDCLDTENGKKRRKHTLVLA